MGVTHSNLANRPCIRRSAERNANENVHMREGNTRQRQELEQPDNIILSQVSYSLQAPRHYFRLCHNDIASVLFIGTCLCLNTKINLLNHLL